MLAGGADRAQWRAGVNDIAFGQAGLPVFQMRVVMPFARRPKHPYLAAAQPALAYRHHDAARGAEHRCAALGEYVHTRMAAVAEVPLIPMALWGGQRLWTKGRPRALTRRHVPISILVGEPLRPRRRDDQAEVAAELRTRMSTLLDRAQREYPDKPAGPDDEWWQPAHLGGAAPTPESLMEEVPES